MQTHSLAAFQHEAEGFVRGLVPHTSRATIVALSGDLGAGKTTFVQAMAHTLGITDVPKSPTFVVMQMYPIPVTSSSRGFARLVHIDAYRLEGGAPELKVLRWEELCADPKNLICIEWPEMVNGALPGDAIQINLRYLDEDSREVLVTPGIAGKRGGGTMDA